MAYKSANYTPNAKSKRILDAAWAHIRSVAYEVSVRWLFYRVLQDGFYSKKSDYKTFVELTAKARHNLYGGWQPNTLVDEVRHPHECQTGDMDAIVWAADLAKAGVRCDLDHWYRQEFYVEIWFEANAMIRQFQHYTRGITLRPFGGQPSIPYKFDAAKAIEKASERYGLPVVVLYFGDYDKAGLTIPQTVERDVHGWCNVDFTLVRAGLNAGDAERYGIPENPEKPGEYQWEALDDNAASDLIQRFVSRYVDDSLIDDVEAEASQVEAQLKTYLKNFTYIPGVYA